MDPEAELREQLAAHREEFGRLVSLPAWQYVKDIARVFLTEYKCKPGKTAEERIKWETYTSMKWLLDQVVFTAEAAASRPAEPVRQVQPPAKRKR